MIPRVSQVVKIVAALAGLTQPQLIERLQRAATGLFADGDYELASELRDLAAQLAENQLRGGNVR